MSDRNHKIKERAKRKQLLSKIRTFDDPVLHTPCEAISLNSDLSFLHILEDVCKAASNGVGLAAPQVGLSVTAAYIFPDRTKGYFIVNPIIISKGIEMITETEGCLSFPGYAADVSRHEWIVVEYFNEKWEKITRSFEGWAARIVQHEIDHLLGVNITDKNRTM